MSNISQLLNAVISILILIFLGVLLRKIKLLKFEDAQVLNNIIVYLSMPALVFYAIYTSDLSWSFFKITLLAFLIMGISLTIAWVAGRRFSLKPTTFGALLLVCTFGNTGYIGYTLSLEVYGKSGLVKAFFYDIFGTAVVLFTVGLYIAETYGEHSEPIKKLKEIATFPPLLALVLAVILKGVALPTVILKPVDYLGKTAIPLIMLSVGLSLKIAEIRVHAYLIGFVCLLKLLLAPFIAFFIGQGLAMPVDMLKIAVLEASMPAAMFSLIIGAKYKLDVDFLPAAIVTTTLLSLISIPLGQYILNAVL